MEVLETNTALTLIFVLALALFFLHKYTATPFKKVLKKDKLLQLIII